MDAYPTLTAHAAKRAIEWNLSLADIHFIWEHGKRLRKTGAIFCQMLAKHMPDEVHSTRYERLVGTTVLTCACGRYVITVYRNEKAFKADAKKPDYRRGSKACCANCKRRVA